MLPHSDLFLTFPSYWSWSNMWLLVNLSVMLIMAIFFYVVCRLTGSSVPHKVLSLSFAATSSVTAGVRPLSPTFGTVNHDAPRTVLNYQFAVSSVVPDWLQSCLSSHTLLFTSLAPSLHSACWNVLCHKESCLCCCILLTLLIASFQLVTCLPTRKDV